MFNKFLSWLEKHGRKRVILDRESKDPYLERYYLFLKDRKNFPFNIFLHSFKKSDPTDLHDHPWPYMTIVLKGGYWEWIPKYKNGRKSIIVGEEKVWRGPGHIRTCAADSYHRIELDPNVKECWTLFIPGKQKRDWGFLTHRKWKNFKWVQNEQYIIKKRKGRKKNEKAS